MRLFVFTIASAAFAAAGANAIDVQEIPGYEAIPEPTTNKYSEIASSILPTFSIDSLEPTYMPDEDLAPTGLQARSVATPSQTATAASVADGPADDSYEVFVKWMISRGLEGYTEDDEKKLIARDVNAPTTTPIADPPTDGPADESFQAFVEWMEGRHLEGTIEKQGVRNHARGVPVPAEAATDGPADDSFDAFVKWMESRGVFEGTEHHARSLDGEDEYLPVEEHELYARSAEAGAYPEEEGDEPLDWSQVFNEELQLHARSLQDDEPVEDGEYEDYDQEHEAPPIGRRSAPEETYPVEEDFEQFLARHGYSPEEYSTTPTESDAEEAAEPQVHQVEPKAASSTGVAAPAAAPTPKPTSAISSPISTPTSAASQWSEVASETALDSSTNVQARSVSSHFRFRHHHTTLAHLSLSTSSGSSSSSGSSGTVSATSATATGSTTATTTSRKGFFGLPW